MAKYANIIIDISHEKLDKTFQYRIPPEIKDEIVLKMPGTANVYNSLAAMEAAHLLGISPETIRKTLRNVSVKGRIEEVRISDKFDVVIDYAHNAASLESLILFMAFSCYHNQIVLLCLGNSIRNGFSSIRDNFILSFRSLHSLFDVRKDCFRLFISWII